MTNYKINFIFSIFLLISSNAFAINIQDYKFSDSFRYSYLEDTGLEHFKSPLTFSLSYAHTARPLYITDSSSNAISTDIVKSYDLFSIGSALKISDQFSASINTTILQANIQGHVTHGFGDSFLRGKYLILNDQNSGFSINPFLEIPTGSQGRFSTTKSISPGFLAIYERQIADFHFIGGLGYQHADKNIYSIINYRNLMLSEFGISYDLNQWWNLNLEMNRNFTFATDYHQDEGKYYIIAKNKTFNKGSTYFGMGIAGLNSLDRKTWSALFGLKFEQ